MAAELSRRQLLGMAGGLAVVATTAGMRTAGAAAPTVPGTPPAPVTAPGTGGGFVPAPDPTPIAIDGLYNNDGIDTAQSRGGDFGGSGYTYPGEVLAGGPVTVGGVPFVLGPSDTAVNNNVVALGQQVALPPGRYLSVQLLCSAGYGPASGTATVHYADGSSTQVGVTAPDWYSSSGPLSAPYRYRPDGSKDAHQVSMFVVEIGTDVTKDAVALTLPTTAQPAPNVTSMHIFAMTAQPAATGRSLLVRDAHSTTSLLYEAGPQTVEATVVNAGTEWITTSDRLRILVHAPGVRTVRPAEVRWLAPGEQVRLRIGIDSRRSPGTVVTGAVQARRGNRAVAQQESALTLGIPDYRPSVDSLSTHQAPYWFDDAKFGIFIHWGVYSVPAWGPVGQEYAEWYWNNMQNPNDPTYAYHAKTYGEDFNYDDFIPMFTAARFDPRKWVELISDAGAEYYVLTSKHHEGFALWDSKVSGRNAVQLGPKKDLIGLLFEASRQHTPHLRNGLYYSLPEWFNPDNPWMGHAPRNPYTLQPVPYTGYQAGRDYVSEYQGPQLLELIEGYDPDVLWYDIGGVNENVEVVLPAFLNHAKDRRRPKDVTFNDRGGVSVHDFTTPEYTTYANTVVAKWEASRGLDPRSYGYNRATPDNLYMTAEEVVQTLADIVSKNGNFLLDIGPDFDGTIPQIMQRRLSETGAWLRTNGESIYGTTYWSRMAQLGSLRFTVKQNQAFYIHSFENPGSSLTVSAPVPIRPGDRVTMLGYPRPLDWSTRNGSLVIEVPRLAQRAGNYDWVFKIDWH